jgi:hypothetical protein
MKEACSDSNPVDTIPASLKILHASVDHTSLRPLHIELETVER